MTSRDEGTSPTIPTTVSVPAHGEERDVTGSQSATITEPELPTTTPQHHGGEPQHLYGGSNSSGTNEHGEEQFHRRNKAPDPTSITQDDRDLEKGEPSAPLSFRAPLTAGQVLEEGHVETTEKTVSEVAGQNNGLVQFLISKLGERRYREYAMGCGNVVHRSFLVKKITGNISTWSSSRQAWKPLRYLATILQHLVSRWVFSGYRKHFETFHPHLHDGTAVHLLQNVGNPSDRWINKTLIGCLGLDPVFLLEHLALIYDGTPVGLTLGSSSSRRARCTSAWHVRAAISDQPMLQFSPLSAIVSLESARIATISFQQTSHGSCGLSITLWVPTMADNYSPDTTQHGNQGTAQREIQGVFQTSRHLEQNVVEAGIFPDEYNTRGLHKSPDNDNHVWFVFTTLQTLLPILSNAFQVVLHDHDFCRGRANRPR